MASHPLMIPMRGLYGQPRDHYVGEFRPAVVEVRDPARLLNHRRAPGAVLATIDDNGVLRLLRLTSVDHPELTRLGDADRATLQAAVMAIHRQHEGGPADGNP